MSDELPSELDRAWAVTVDAMRALVDWPDLAAYWPTLEDVPDGRDMFPHLPISGLPDDETLSRLVCDGHVEEDE